MNHSMSSRLFHVASFESLPDDLFCVVLSYLGPTSSSLLSLAQTNRRFRRQIYQIGNNFILRASRDADTVDTCNTVAKTTTVGDGKKSSICLFLRHAQPCQRIYEECHQLHEYIERTVSSHEVLCKVLSKAFDLVSISSRYLRSNSEIRQDRHIFSTERLRVLEDFALKVCGKCGAKGFKWAKSQLTATTEETSRPILEPAVQDILNKSLLLMQMVVCQRVEQHAKHFQQRKTDRQGSHLCTRIVSQQRCDDLESDGLTTYVCRLIEPSILYTHQTWIYIFCLLSKYMEENIPNGDLSKASKGMTLFRRKRHSREQGSESMDKVGFKRLRSSSDII